METITMNVRGMTCGAASRAYSGLKAVAGVRRGGNAAAGAAKSRSIPREPGDALKAASRARV